MSDSDHTASSPSLTLSSVPVQKQNVMAQGVLDEMVLYDGGEEIGYTLNASARSIWDLCDGRRSVLDICTNLGTHLQVDPKLLEDDVLTAINHFASLGLLNN